MTARRAATESRRTALVATVCALIALLTSCVTVPTAGPVRKVEGQQQTCQNCVDVVVDAPSLGDDPRRIVEGYLRATSNYQPNYSVAKQFLTMEAAEKWSPEDGASIYKGSPTANGDQVILDALLIGKLDGHRSYTAKDTRLRHDFKLTKEDGEWRIGNPPAGLLVTESSFTRFYSPYSLYFFGNGRLVPDAIYLPDLRNQANIASVLVKALLSGPSAWLRPAVTSAIPPNTALSGDAVTTSDGIATVPLNDPVLQLNEQQRLEMAAQVVYTLREAVGIKGVIFTVNQQPLRVPPVSDQVSFVVPADAIPGDLGPIPAVAGDQLYLVRKGAVAVVEDGTPPPKAQPVLGDLGKARYRVDSLAVSTGNTDLAAVTNDRTTVRWSPTTTGEVTTVLSGARNLLRPQFSRFGELWVIGGSGGDQRMWVFTADKKIEVAASKILGKGEVTAFKISPDGARLALIRKANGRTELGLARISRADKITVDGWRPVDTTQTGQQQLRRLQDVAWIDATELLVLGSPSASVALRPFRISQDASSITAEGESTNWEAIELAVLLRKQTVIAVTRSGQTHRDQGSEWLPFLDKVSTVAYPG